MRNIKINEAESIFETFWDVGESYPNSEKYSCLVQYQMKMTGNVCVSNEWDAVGIKMSDCGDGIVMERDCNLEIEEYDIFRICANVSENVRLKVICDIDGKDIEIINDCGYNRNKEYNGKIDGKIISHIRLEFKNNKKEESTSKLLWLGLSNFEAERKMLSRKTPYDDNWEGCFAEKYDMYPQHNIYFDKNELNDLRRKLNKPPFDAHMALLRTEAKAALKIVPENEIGDYVHKKFLRFVRERDVNKVDLTEQMQKLAFVGIIDEDYDMLRMACRMALSVAHCRYFCESIIGVFPGATWHHRSFTEECVCKALVSVLEWAGGLLTWHGKNIIYDAIIMKGLPRLDADIKTMDYIWNMNQGPAFVSSLVITLIALSKRYPRYLERVSEAESNMFTMWENYICSDGGATEGPQYWDFTLSQMTDALYLLAKHKNIDIEKYVPESIVKTLNYATAVLSEVDNYYIPINDSHINKSFGGGILSFLANVSKDELWKKLSNAYLYKKPASTDRMISYLIFAKEFDEKSTETKKEFISMPIAGISNIRRKTKEFNMVSFSAICEKMGYCHSHKDKGSFVLEADNKALLIDRGMCDYNNPYQNSIKESEMHNLSVAVKQGELLSQHMYEGSIETYIIQDEYTDGVYIYGADITQPWCGYFRKNIRRIISPNPCLYLICDEIETEKDISTCFVLNTYGKILRESEKCIISEGKEQINIHPLNWIPDKIEIGEFGVDGIGRPVNRLCLHGKSGVLVTVIELSKFGETKLDIINHFEINYGTANIKINGNNIVIDERKYQLTDA